MSASLPVTIAAALPTETIERMQQGLHEARGTMAAETVRAMQRAFEAFRLGRPL